MTYIPLHVHSIYSPFEGMMTLQELVDRASFLKFPALALTDHRSIYGHYEFFNLAKKAGIKPVLGAELCHSSLVGGKELYHLTVLAENDSGYRNLISLVNCHYKNESERYVTPEELKEHSEGLIALTGCLKGETSQAIQHGNLGRARDVAEKLLHIFGASRLFLEIMNHNLPEERLVIDHLTLLSKRLDVPLVVTNNDRYLRKDKKQYYEILHSLRSGEHDSRKEWAPDEYYLKKDKDLEPYFYSVSDALKRSGEIAERCSVELRESGRIVFSMHPNPADMLSEMCHRRFLLKFHNMTFGEMSYLRRIMEKELDCARREKLSGFIIFLRDLFRVSSRRGIWLELMSSNLLESFVAYLLGIVSLNPIDHDLIFESFSYSRPGIPPTVEIFTSKCSKESLIEIIKELLPGYQPFYKVTQEEMSLQTVVKEVGEVLGMEQELCEELSRLLMSERRHRALASMLEGSEALRQLYNSKEVVRRTLHASYALWGRIFKFHLNSSKLVILPKGIEEISSFITRANGERFILLNNSTIEAMGGWILVIQHSHFISALEKVVREVGEKRDGKSLFRTFEDEGGKRWVPEVLKDPQVYALISSGETDGVYLLESQGIRELLAKIKPSTFEELVNVISLYRPAPLEGKLWQRYIENAGKKGKVFLPHHYLAASLEKTRGLLLYREQVREILNYTAGLEYERARAVEGALRRQDSGELMNARLEFIRGAMDNGLDEEEAQQIFDFLLHNIAFTHNKALSSSQAYLSYRTAFFKAHLFNEYFVALLNSNMDVRDRQRKYIEYLELMDINLLPVDINSSGEEYGLEEDGIRTNLQSVKAIDKSELQDILRERSARGDFASFKDFLNRMFGRVSMKAVLGLIDEGAFDGHSSDRDGLKIICTDFFEGGGKAGFFKPATKTISFARKKKESPRQISLFEGEQQE